jgi:low affinity Fe/Cu permease
LSGVTRQDLPQCHPSHGSLLFRRGKARVHAQDELIRVSTGSNQFIGIEHLTQEEVERFQKQCAAVARATAGNKGRKSNTKKDRQK